MERQIRLLLLHVLCATITTAQSQSPVCPGVPIVYMCATASPGNNHVWRGTAFSGQCSSHSPPDEISISTLSSASDEVGESLPCGVFTATVTSVTGGISSELTFTASLDLNGLAVECAGGVPDMTTIQVHTPPAPVFSGGVVQDRSRDSADRTTAIAWTPATVSSGGVTYETTAMTDNGTTVVIDNTQATARVTVPQFNMDYTVCIEAFNSCDNPSGTPACTTVIIEAEAVVSDLSIGLVCSSVEETGDELLAQGANVTWTVDNSRNGDILRPAVTMADLDCEQDTAQGLSPSDTEFMFSSASHPECFSSSQTEFSLELVNEAGPATEMESVSLSVIGFPATFSHGSPSVFTLNALCSESPTDFSIRIMYRPLSSQGNYTTAESQYDGSVNGFPVTLEGLSDNVTIIEYDLTLFYRGNNTGSVSNRTGIVDLPGGPPIAAIVVPVAVVVIGGLSLIVNILIICYLVRGPPSYLCCLGWAGCGNEEGQRMNRVTTVFVWVLIWTPVTTVILICYLCCRCCHSSSNRVFSDEEMKLRGNTLTQSQDPADNLPTYADPSKIRREEAAGTHDLYTVSDKLKKKPATVEPENRHQRPSSASLPPESGQLYTVIDQTTRKGSQKKPAEPQAKSDEEIAAMDSMPGKSKGKSPKYSELIAPNAPSGTIPLNEPVEYSEVHTWR